MSRDNWTDSDIIQALKTGVNIGMQNVNEPRYKGDFNFDQKKCIRECMEYLQRLGIKTSIPAQANKDDASNLADYLG